MSSRQESIECEGRATDRGILASIAAIVTAVPDGKSPFVVTYPEPESLSEIFTDKTSITFSLSLWKDNVQPELGQVVSLQDLRRFTHGWRAKSIRVVRAEISSKQ